jgi:thiol-disulfide isomerase/thioredoxin
MLAAVLGGMRLAGGLADPPAEQVSVLRREVDDAEAAYHRSTGADERHEMWEKFRRASDRNVPRILELIRQAPTSETALETLAWIVANPRNGSRPYALEVVQLLRDHHGVNPEVGRVCRTLGESWAWEILRPTAEFLRTAAERNPNRLVRAQATFALARLTKDKAGYRESWESAPPSVVALLNQCLSGDLDAWKKEDLTTVTRQAERLFETVIDKYADCADQAQQGQERQPVLLAEQAKAELHELGHLAVGKVAPEVEGEDLDGRKLRLSDFRGKVVVLTFWASWCAPCMRMVPQERALVDRLKDKPFACIGVNGDSDRVALKAVREQQGITWPSFWSGGPAGPIPTAWNVRYWPTVYVLDPEGKIRFKANAGAGVEEVVDRLLLELADQQRARQK